MKVTARRLMLNTSFNARDFPKGHQNKCLSKLSLTFSLQLLLGQRLANTLKNGVKRERRTNKRNIKVNEVYAAAKCFICFHKRFLMEIETEAAKKLEKGGSETGANQMMIR